MNQKKESGFQETLTLDNAINDINPQYNSFVLVSPETNSKVGELKIEKEQLVFEGNVDESSKVFIAHLLQSFNGQINSLLKKDCLKTFESFGKELEDKAIPIVQKNINLGKDPKEDAELKEIFMVSAHLEEIIKYLNKK